MVCGFSLMDVSGTLKVYLDVTTLGFAMVDFEIWMV
jgi:hypothetical protein